MLATIVSCKTDNKINAVKKTATPKENTHIIIGDSTLPKKNVWKSLTTINDFKKLLKAIKTITNTGRKHTDMLTNSSAGFIHNIFSLEEADLSVKTTSYEYKKNVVFYLHTIRHINDTISLKPFIEKAQGNRTKGYLGERVLIFAMKNDSEVNYIDIPANWNYIELKEELLDTLYKSINGDIIECYRTRKCRYQDLRHIKPE